MSGQSGSVLSAVQSSGSERPPRAYAVVVPSKIIVKIRKTVALRIMPPSINRPLEKWSNVTRRLMHGPMGCVLRFVRTKVFCFFFSKKMLPSLPATY